jgi:hypothetical protein
MAAITQAGNTRASGLPSAQQTAGISGGAGNQFNAEPLANPGD